MTDREDNRLPQICGLPDTGSPNATVDFHCHLLPAFDDGPATLEESCEMARLLAAPGFRTTYCTPHYIRGSYDATSSQVRSAVASMQSELDKTGIELQLLPGREYYLDEFLLDAVTADPQPLGESNLLLAELPRYAVPEQVRQICSRLTCSGYRVMIAHPERSPLLELKQETRPRRVLSAFRKMLAGKPAQESPDMAAAASADLLLRTSNPLLNYLQDLGCAFQGNLGSFVGQYGGHVRANALRLRQAGIYGHYGSDGHNAGQLRALLSHDQTV